MRCIDGLPQQLLNREQFVEALSWRSRESGCTFLGDSGFRSRLEFCPTQPTTRGPHLRMTATSGGKQGRTYESRYFAELTSTLRNVTDTRRRRGTPRSCLRALIPCRHWYLASPVITRALPGLSEMLLVTADGSIRVNSISHADPRLTVEIVSPKHGSQSMWAEMPRPGKYSLMIA